MSGNQVDFAVEKTADLSHGFRSSLDKLCACRKWSLKYSRPDLQQIGHDRLLPQGMLTFWCVITADHFSTKSHPIYTFSNQLTSTLGR